MQIGRIASVALALAACDSGKKAAPHMQSAALAAPRDAAVMRDAPQADAAVATPPTPPTPATPPTKDQALAAGKAWLKAGATKSTAKLRAASALPFHVIDEYDDPSCEKDATIADDADFDELAACLQNTVLRPAFAAKDVMIDATAEPPPPDSFIQSHAASWNGIVSEAQRANHAFVSVITGPPSHPADVLYLLLSVRLDAGAPKVDGAVLVYSLQGD